MTPDIDIKTGPEGRRIKIDLDPPEWLAVCMIVLTAFAAWWLSK